MNYLLALPFFLLAAPITLAFSDIAADYKYNEAVNYLAAEEIIAGYPDGTFGAEKKINRAEFTKIVLGSVATVELTPPAEPCFPDVPVDAWYAPFVCAAKERGIIGGYPDGSFGPAKEINLVESAKIVAGAYELQVAELQDGEDWFMPFLNALSERNAIPDSFITADQAVQRGQFAELIWRVKTDRRDRPAVTADAILNPTCQALGEDLPGNLDMTRIRETVLGWYNTERQNAKLHIYNHNRQLDRTASAWARQMKSDGKVSHKRTPTSSFYDYAQITDWFAQQGITVANVNRITHTENVGSPYYTCPSSQADCTAEALAAIRTTFDAYLAEGQGNGLSHAHYQSIMQPEFAEWGLGLATDDSKTNLFLVIHFATEITSDPLPVCGD